MAVNAKLCVFPSFQPRRVKKPKSEVMAWSWLMPAPYLSVPTRSVAVTLGVVSGLLGDLQRFGVIAGLRAIGVVEHAHGAGVFGDLLTPLRFPGLTMIAKQAAIELRAVGDLGLGGDAVAERPVARVEFLHDAPGVAARVGRIIPGAVVHDAPRHELRARIVGVGRCCRNNR